jgi:hypothetical protein
MHYGVASCRSCSVFIFWTFHVFVLNKSCILKDFRLKKTIKDAQLSLHVVFHVNHADTKDVLMLECQWNWRNLGDQNV